MYWWRDYWIKNKARKSELCVELTLVKKEDESQSDEQKDCSENDWKDLAEAFSMPVHIAIDDEAKASKEQTEKTDGFQVGFVLVHPVQ